jgi:DNA-binding MarR family transcriptional regulator
VSVDGRPRHALLRELLACLGRSAVQHNLFVQAVATQLGVAATDVESLLLLKDQGPATAGELAEALGLTTGGVTGSVDRLVGAGLAVRDADPSDRRRVIVRPTEQLSRLDDLLAPVVVHLERSLDALPATTLEQLIAVEAQAISALQYATAALRQRQTGSGAAASFSAALGQTRQGTLEFTSGAANVRILAADAASSQLYRATFEGAQPSVRAQSGSVSVRYKRMGPFEWASGQAGSIALHPGIPWRFAFLGGASDVQLDARALQLAGVRVEGGADKFDLLLPPPRGSVQLCFEGGQNRLHIQRPDGVALQLLVQGGANRLEFDARRFGAVGGDLRLASPGWEQAEDRYIVELRGGASRLTVSEVEEVWSNRDERHE